MLAGKCRHTLDPRESVEPDAETPCGEYLRHKVDVGQAKSWPEAPVGIADQLLDRFEPRDDPLCDPVENRSLALSAFSQGVEYRGIFNGWMSHPILAATAYTRARSTGAVGRNGGVE